MLQNKDNLRQSNESKGLRLAWFTTARDQAALDLLRITWEKKQEGFFNLHLPVVWVSRDYGENKVSDRFMDWARENGLTVQTLSAARFRPELRRQDLAAWRLDYDREISERISACSFDWIFLAGYMWIVSPILIKKFRIINLHPAPPGGPKGTWQEVLWETLQKRLPEAGAQIHLVTEALDEGPPLTYATFPLNTNEWVSCWRTWEEKVNRQGWAVIQKEEGEREPFFAKVRAKELSLEFPLILWTLKTLETGRLTVQNHRVQWDGEWLPEGYCLNREIAREGK
jgi:phosphoribosylglycinamide formyltransferase 1